MTENEAVNKLKQHFEYLKHAWKPHPDYETMEAIGMAIHALEEVQARNKKVWHRPDEIPYTEDSYIVAWLPKGEQSRADTPHYYSIWSYEDGEWQIYVPNNFAGKEIILIAWIELPEPYK